MKSLRSKAVRVVTFSLLIAALSAPALAAGSGRSEDGPFVRDPFVRLIRAIRQFFVPFSNGDDMTPPKP